MTGPAAAPGTDAGTPSGTLPGAASVPDVAVILIVRHPMESPDAVLDALADQPESAGFAVIVVDGRPQGVPDPALQAGPGNVPGTGAQSRGAGRPGVTVIRAPGLNMPLLKARGVAATAAAAVAFLEPKAVPAPGWAAALVRARAARPLAAIGGAVRLAGAPGPADQAAFIFEYAEFSASRISAGQTRDLPGNNMVLPRGALLAHCSDILLREGLNKPFCQARLMAAGVPVQLVADMAVDMSTRHRLGGLLSSRMRYARCFGGTRVALAAPRRRWYYRLGAPAVPLVVLARRMGGAGHAETGPRRPGTLPALALLCLAWAAGEIAGYWRGTGSACDRLY